MGCGAVCGSTSAVIETTQQAQKHLKSLFKKMTPNLFLFPMQKFAAFGKQLQLNPRKFQLVLVDKLQAKSEVPVGVKEKWKIILFGLDTYNSSYINCLGYPQKKSTKKTSMLIQGQNGEEQAEFTQNAEQKSQIQIFQHKYFSQIEKDVVRSLTLPESQKETFAFILRRITNHFPSMGYTQGINLIVAYLLVVGYSKTDAFWMFTHIALNRRYMLLGLFQDGFPLSSVYIIIFRNMLKRFNQKLYHHLYETVVVDQSIWVFKWFITYYLYSFPLEMCQYIWDIVISVGGIGLVTFAVSLIDRMESKLMTVEEPYQISQLFEDMKDIEYFNSVIKIGEVVKMAYSIKIVQDDLVGLKNLKTCEGKSNLYAQYYFVSLGEEVKNEHISKQQNSPEQFSITDPILFKKFSQDKGQDVLDKWYSKLVQQREKFKQFHLKRKAAGEQSPGNISFRSSFIEQLQAQKKSEIQNIDLSKQEAQSNKNDDEDEIQQLDKFSSSYRQSFPNNAQKNRPSSRRSDFKKKEEIWDDEQQQLQEKGDIMNLEDDFCYVPPKDLRFKRRVGFGRTNDKYSYVSDPKSRQKYRGTTTKTDSSEGMKFVAVGHSVINTVNITNNASRSSISSQTNTQKENYSGRYCNCKSNKNKTQQKEQALKKSVESHHNQNVPQHEDSLQKMIQENTKRKRINTYHNWMANSQVPEVKNTSTVKQSSEIGSQVQIYNGRQMFKKKNRGKIQAVSTINDMHRDEMRECSQCQALDGPNLDRLGFEEQSFDSIMLGNGSSQKSSIISCQIESVK